MVKSPKNTKFNYISYTFAQVADWGGAWFTPKFQVSSILTLCTEPKRDDYLTINKAKHGSIPWAVGS